MSDGVFHERHVPLNRRLGNKHIFKSHNPTFTNFNDVRTCHCGGTYNVNYKWMHLKTSTHVGWKKYISAINECDNIDINHDGIVKYIYCFKDKNLLRNRLGGNEKLNNKRDRAKNAIELLFELYNESHKIDEKLNCLHRACTICALYMLGSTYYMRWYIKLAKIYKELCDSVF
jgi:hypothetical protein